MALKVSFSRGSSRILSDTEIDQANAKLDKILSPNFGKGKIRDMIADGLELKRLSEELESGVSGDERAELEKAFYSLAGKIREETDALVEKNGRERSATGVNGETNMSPEGRAQAEPHSRPSNGRPAMVIHVAGDNRLHGVRVSLRNDARTDEPSHDSEEGYMKGR
ncbi:hypothetical protein [Pseudomonas sp. MWU12-3103b]|uniref:hypothetical protein n=1 Tax=Pseudomonas sp. MWU12-3103b TaxID=2928857 RepID=UPI001FFFEC4E|nr:hypothetical protein [Pseudomonas sp. MWU12-3103b]